MEEGTGVKISQHIGPEEGEMYSLQIEQPKTAKGLSSMKFCVRQWYSLNSGEGIAKKAEE